MLFFLQQIAMIKINNNDDDADEEAVVDSRKMMMYKAQLQFYPLESDRSYDDTVKFEHADENKTGGRRTVLTTYVNKRTYTQQLGGIITKILNDP